jgi:hypothetical protein
MKFSFKIYSGYIYIVICSLYLTRYQNDHLRVLHVLVGEHFVIFR